MFTKMRRFNQELPMERNIQILKAKTNGVLAVSGENNYPYAVPLNYVYDQGKIYFHSAKAGHKITGISNNPRVSFCVVDQDKIIQETFTSHFRSVIVFGKAKLVQEENEKIHALRKLIEKYSPDYIQAGHKEIESGLNHVAIYAIEIDHMTGKQAKELIED
ncbi:MAG: pyridoxamine 5'-phosphate oxidase family protein [Clostridia bacterium]|nr:pyridoxamine 5'-phosphate oxidase family protein [Clostridia bacterium]